MTGDIFHFVFKFHGKEAVMPVMYLRDIPKNTIAATFIASLS